MSTAKTKEDAWDSADLQDAAVEYCAERMPPPGRVESVAGAEWRRRCAAKFAAELGVPAARLEEMLRRYKAPVNVRLPDACGFVATAERDETGEWSDLDPLGGVDARASARQNEALTGTGLMHEPENALSALLAEEEWSLQAGERQELARVLEEGLPLSREQRQGLGLMLRGSGAAARADLARGLLLWLCPQLAQPVYGVRREELVLRAPCRVERWSASRVLATSHRALNGQHLRFIEDETGRARVYFYAACRERPARRQGTRCFEIRSLQTKGNAHDDTGLRKNLTLLAAFVQHDTTTGVGWARTFGETKAMVSVRRARITQLLNEGTGGKAHLPGMRHRPDPRKGTTLKAG